MKRLLFAFLLLPVAAAAQIAQPTAKPDMVLLPREVATAAANWIAQPDAATAVKLYAALSACINDNPSGGAVTRMGQDQCAVVTDALAARDKEMADLRAKLAEATKPAAQPPAKKD